MSPEAPPEPWLRGPLAAVDSLLAPTLHALMQAEEDLHHHTPGLHDDQVWTRPHGLTSLGFHLRHIAGSLDRLTTYLANGQLTGQQMEFLRAESQPGATLKELLSDVGSRIRLTSATIRLLDIDTLRDARTVGRKRLPTTVMGLVVHIAEHTQRHVGQAITIGKLLRTYQAESDHRERG